MSEKSENRLQKLGRALTSVAAAAAALMAPQISTGSPIFQQLNHGLTPAAQIIADERSSKKPKQLVLSPANYGSIQFVGHRSHSSHSSHRSHVSGSSYRGHVSHTSHRSHVSGSGFAPSSSGTSSAPRGVSPVNPRTTSPTRRPATSSNGLLDRSSPSTTKKTPREIETPQHAHPDAQSKLVAPNPVPVRPAAPLIDFDNPVERFQVVSFARVKGTIQAAIMDLKTQKRHVVAQGDMLEDYSIFWIDLPKREVILQGPQKEIIPITMKKRSR